MHKGSVITVQEWEREREFMFEGLCMSGGFYEVCYDR